MIKKKKLLTIPVILSIIPISLSLNGIISNSPLIQKIDSNHNATTTTAATSTLVDQTTLLTAINADKIVQSNSFSGNFANLNLNPITVTVGGYYLFSSATPKENNLNFTLTNKNSVFIDNSQNDSTLKENILKNTNFQMDVNDWDLKNTTNFSLDNDKFTTYFDINNFKKIDSTITSSFYTLNTYSYDLVSKTNTSTTNGTTTLWSLTSQTFPRGKTAFFWFYY